MGRPGLALPPPPPPGGGPGGSMDDEYASFMAELGGGPPPPPANGGGPPGIDMNGVLAAAPWMRPENEGGIPEVSPWPEHTVFVHFQ